MRLTDLDEWREVVAASAKDPDAQLAASLGLLRGAEEVGERSLILLALDRLLELRCRRGEFDLAAGIVQRLSSIERGPESALTAFAISRYPELVTEALELAATAVRSAPLTPALCRRLRGATSVACRRALWQAINGDQRRALDGLGGLYALNIQFLPGVAALIEDGAVPRARGRGSSLARAAWRSSDATTAVLSMTSWRRFRGACTCGACERAGPLEDSSVVTDESRLRELAGAMVTARLVHIRLMARASAPGRQSLRSIHEADRLLEALEPCSAIVCRAIAALSIRSDLFDQVTLDAFRSVQWEQIMCRPRPRRHQLNETLSQLRALLTAPAKE